MFLVGLLQWWYGRGFKGHLIRVGQRLQGTLEYFSIGRLVATLGAPFRQISVGVTGSGPAALLQNLIDQLVSRTIGMIVRGGTIIIGSIGLLIQVISEVIIALGWLLLPVVPIAGLILTTIGWVPSWQ